MCFTRPARSSSDARPERRRRDHGNAPTAPLSPSPRTRRSRESSTEAGVGVESATVPWAILTTECRIGDLLTRGDVCHLSADRGDAERCGVLLGGTPELVRLDEIRPAVYRVVWSLSTAASGRLRPARPLS